MGHLHRRVPDHAKAVEYFEKAQMIASALMAKTATAFSPYSLACVHSLALLTHQLKHPDANASQAVERKRLEQIAVQSVKDVVQRGIATERAIRQEPDFDILHGVPEFEALFPK